MIAKVGLAILLLLSGAGVGVAGDSDTDALAELSARIYERGAEGAIRGRRLADAPAAPATDPAVPLHDVAEPELKASDNRPALTPSAAFWRRQPRGARAC